MELVLKLPESVSRGDLMAALEYVRECAESLGAESEWNGSVLQLIADALEQAVVEEFMGKPRGTRG